MQQPSQHDAERHLRALARRVKTCVETQHWECQAAVQTLDCARYLDPAQWEQEQTALFRRRPLIAAHDDELPADGGALEVTLAGRSLLLTRDDEGTVRAFLNSCRHRGMALLEAGEQRCKHRVNCPYHGWSYGLDGRLRGLPHAEAFPGLNPADYALREVPCEQRHGLIWVQVDRNRRPTDIAGWLGSLDADFAALGLGDCEIYRVAHSSVQANWKLCVDAFLEAYHVKVLHRNSVGPFFEDALAVYDIDGPHFRSAVARKGLDLAKVDALDMAALRNTISYTHFVYPNHIFIFHPDYISQTSILPSARNRFEWVHRMLIPRGQNTAALAQHWENSYRLIEEGVFQAEDLHAAEQIQRGLESGNQDPIPIGQLEVLIGAFHQQRDTDLQRSAPARRTPPGNTALRG